MSTVLLKTASFAKATEGVGGGFVVVQRTEVGISEGQVSVRVEGVFEHDTVGGTVDWFQPKAGVLGRDEEHGFLDILEVATLLPQIQVEKVR